MQSYWFYRDALAACRGTDLRPVWHSGGGGWQLEPKEDK